MSGWLGCCDCLQRRAMAPALRSRGARPVAMPPPHGHHNPAFVGDDDMTAPPHQHQRQHQHQHQHQHQLSDHTAGPETVQSPTSPSSERYPVAPQLIRPQFREICDLRDDPPGPGHRPASSRRPRPRPQPRGSPVSSSEDHPVPATHSEPFEPLACDWDAERTSPTEPEPGAVPQRRGIPLDDIPETRETNGAAKATELIEDCGTVENGMSRVTDESESVSPPRAVRWVEDAGPAAEPDSAQSDGVPRTGRARAASLGAPRRLAFPRFRRRSSQRRQSTEGAGGGRQRGREPSQERSWLRRFSRSRASDALQADQPPEQPPQSSQASQASRQAVTAATAATPANRLATRRWGVVRENFDLDAPLSEHWRFLQTGSNNFEKVDAQTYKEHLHEQPPLTSSSSEEDVPDAPEAQLMLKMARAQDIRQPKSPVSSRCVEHARQRRHAQRQRSSGEEAQDATETSECQQLTPAEVRQTPAEKQPTFAEEQPMTAEAQPTPAEAQPAPVEEGERSEVSAPSADWSDSGYERHSPVELQKPVPGVPQSSAGLSPPPGRASSCPPPQYRARAASVGMVASRRHRGSILGRLLAPPAGQSRRQSLPPSATLPTPESRTMRRPSWFQEAGPVPDRQALSRRRATVVEASLRDFMEEVDEKVHHQRDELDSPHHPDAAAADEPVDPLLDVSRRLNLMLADADKHLEKEYGTMAPSQRPSLCPTPRRYEQTEQGGGQENGQTASSGGNRQEHKQVDGDSGARSPGGQTTDGTGCCRLTESCAETGQTAGSSAEVRQTAEGSGCCAEDGSGCCAEDGQTAGSPGCCAEDGQTAGSSGATRCSEQLPDPSDGDPVHSRPAESRAGGPEDAPQTSEQRHCCDSETAAASEGQCRAQTAPSPEGRRSSLGRLPEYLTNIQHEVAAAADALRTKLHAKLHSSRDSEPNSHPCRSKSPPKSAGNRNTSRNSSPSCEDSPSATGLYSELSCTDAAKSIISTAPTPRNSIAFPSHQSSPADSRMTASADPAPVSPACPRCPAPLPLVGYQQMALALARHSTVGYQQLALALARQQTTSAASAAAAAVDGGSVRCQAAQTSPGVASPSLQPPRPAAGHSRSVQTSPGVSTPAEAAAACTQSGVCSQGVPSCPQSDSCAHGAPTCTQSGVCTRASPAVSLGAAAAPAAEPAASLPSPAEEPDSAGPGGGRGWTVPMADGTSSAAAAAPPARLLAYGQPSWVARQKTTEEAAELRHRLDSGQEAARRRRDFLLRRRADRAAELASPPGRPGGDHTRAGPSTRPARR